MKGLVQDRALAQKVPLPNHLLNSLWPHPGSQRLDVSVHVVVFQDERFIPLLLKHMGAISKDLRNLVDHLVHI